MKDTEVKRLVYQDSEAFKEGIKVGKKEMIEKARQWITERYDLDFMGDFKDLLDYIKSF